MSYRETIQYLESFINYEKIPVYPYKESLKLERIKDFLVTIGSPQESLRCIHIAGSKGKGSTCAFIAYIMREAGYSVGLYTSPHLSDFRERIRILNPDSEILIHHEDFEGMISEKELSDTVERLQPAIEKYNKGSPYGALSFFEVYTAAAFVYFKEKKVDCAVLETGLGGRLDATNVVTPLVSAITPISYEHTQKLGKTLAEIATEKAGIIKSGSSSVISAPQEAEAGQVIRKKCEEAGADLQEIGKDIVFQKDKGDFSVKTRLTEYIHLKTNLLGDHQVVNASVAVGVVEALKPFGFDIGASAIRDGLAKTVWPGRCEVICRDPLIILDGAQNIASAQILKKAIKENFKYQKLILVLGISKDKDIKGICDQLRELADEVIVTKADNTRAIEPETLACHFKDKPVRMTHTVREAKILAQRIAHKEDLIVVTGSLFVVGEFRDARL